MPGKTVPFSYDFFEVLNQIYVAYRMLGSIKDPNNPKEDKDDLPNELYSNQVNSLGLHQRKTPTTFTQQMAVMAEKINVILRSEEALADRDRKEKLEKEMAELDEYYTNLIKEKSEELKAAEEREIELRNRYLSAYEMNAPYVQELQNDNIYNSKNPEDANKLVNKYIPIDEFKKEWEEATRIRCKLQNQKTTAECQYLAKSDDLIKRYELTADALKKSSVAIQRADAAWNSILQDIEKFTSMEDVRKFTEDDLGKDPEKGKMSNYDLWRIQSEFDSLATELASLENASQYNNQIKAAEDVNKKIDKFEKKVADTFDSSYADVDLAGENGVYAQLDNMTDEQKKKHELKLKAIDKSREDPQKGVHSDTYGTILRTIKADETRYNDLNKQKDAASATLEKQKTELEQLKRERDEQKNTVDNWKGPDFTEVDKKINLAKDALNAHQKLIDAKNAEIATKKKYIEEVVPKQKEEAQLNIESYKKALGESEEGIKGLQDTATNFDIDYNKVDDKEFTQKEIEEWTKKYAELTKENTGEAIATMLDEGLKQLQEIGTKTAEQRYKVQKLNDQYTALGKFRTAATTDDVFNAKQIAERAKEHKEEIEERYAKLLFALDSEHEAKIKDLRDEITAARQQLSKPNDEELNQIVPEKFDVSDPDDEDYVENQEINELIDANIEDWKTFVSGQEDVLYNHDAYVRKKAEENQKAYDDAIEAAKADRDQKYSNAYIELQNKKEEVLQQAGDSARQEYEQSIEERRRFEESQAEKKEDFIERVNHLELVNADRYNKQLNDAIDKMKREYEAERKQFEEDEIHAIDSKTLQEELRYNESKYYGKHTLLAKLISERDRCINARNGLEKRLVRNEDFLNEEQRKENDDLKRDIKNYSENIEDLDMQIEEQERLHANDPEEIERREHLDEVLRENAKGKAAVVEKLREMDENFEEELEQYKANFFEKIEERHEKELAAFEEDQAKELEEFNATHKASTEVKRIEDKLKQLQDDYDKQYESIRKEYDEKDTLARNKLKTDEAELESDNLSSLKEKQKQDREKFLDEKFETVNDPDVRVAAKSSLVRYQKERADLFESTIGKNKDTLDEKIQKCNKAIEEENEKYNSEIAALEEKYKAEKKAIEVDGDINYGKEIETLAANTEDKLKLNHEKLAQLYAEQATNPMKLSLAEENLKKAEAEYNKAKAAAESLENVGKKKYEEAKQVVKQYKNSHNENQDLADAELKYKSSVEIAKLLAADIDAWKASYGDIPDAAKNAKLADNYYTGKAMYDVINERSEEELSGIIFGTEEARAAEKEKIFRKIEHNLLLECNQQAIDCYELYYAIEQHKKAFMDVMDYTPLQREEFNKRVADASQKAVAVQENREIGADLRVNPIYLLEEIKNAQVNYHDVATLTAQTKIYNKLLGEKDKAAFEEFEANRKKELETLRTKREQLNKEIYTKAPQLDVLKQRIEHLTKNVALSNINISNEVARIQDAQAEINQINNENKGINIIPLFRTNAQKDKLAKDEIKLDKLKKQLSAAKQSKDENVKVNTESTKELQQKKAELKALQEHLGNNKTTIEDLDKKIKELEGKKFSLNLTSEEANKIMEKAKNQTTNLLKQYDNKALTKALATIHEYEHRLEPIKRKNDIELSAKQRIVDGIKAEIHAIELAQHTNDQDIIDCQNAIGKYKVYQRGLGKEYDLIEEELNKEKAELEKLEKQQEEAVKKQTGKQNELKLKIDTYEGILESRDELFAKRRLVRAAVNKYKNDLQTKQEELKALEEKEKLALQKYQELDKYSEILGDIKDTVDPNVYNKVNDVYNQKKMINTGSIADTDRKIVEMEGKIKLLTDKQDIAAKEKELISLYQLKRGYEEEQKQLEAMRAALDLCKVRHELSEKHADYALTKAQLDQAEITQNKIELDIVNLKGELNRQVEGKKSIIERNAKAVAGGQEAYDKLGIEDNEKLVKLNEELKQLTGDKLGKLKDDLSIAEMDKRNLIQDNEWRQKEAKENLVKKEKEILSKDNEIFDTKNKIAILERDIIDEKKAMQLQVLAERKKLGEDILAVDRYDHLVEQKDKLENFQRNHLAPIVNIFANDELQAVESKDAIIKTNQKLRTKMADLVERSKTVKKWYSSNSNEFTNMIEAVKAFAKVEDDAKINVVLEALSVAKKNATAYITKRESDWVQTSSLLRKSRLALAKDILRTSMLMEKSYIKLKNDQAEHEKTLEQFKQNKGKMQLVKESYNSDKLTFDKFSTVYSKPISNSKDEKFKDYRENDKTFENYTKNVYTKTWDKLENKIAAGQPKAVNKQNLDPNVKNPWNPNALVERNLKVDYENTFNENINEINKEMYDKGLDHIKWEQPDSSYAEYNYVKDDSIDYLSINTVGRKIEYDNSIQNFKLDVHKAPVNTNDNINIDYDNEVKGFGNINAPNKQGRPGRSEEKDKDKTIVKQEPVKNL